MVVVGAGCLVLADCRHAPVHVPVGWARDVESRGWWSQERLRLPDIEPVGLFESPRVREPEVLELELRRIFDL